MKRSRLERKSGLSARGKGGACPPKPSGAERNGIGTPKATGLERTPMKRKRPKQRTTASGSVIPAKNRSLIRSDWRERAFEMHDDVCWITAQPAVHAHHVVFLRVLVRELIGKRISARQLKRVCSDPRNAMPMAHQPHLDFHDGPLTICREELPRSVFEFVAEVDAKWDTRLVVWLERTYPSEYPGVQA